MEKSELEISSFRKSHIRASKRTKRLTNKTKNLLILEIPVRNLKIHCPCPASCSSISKIERQTRSSIKDAAQTAAGVRLLHRRREATRADGNCTNRFLKRKSTAAFDSSRIILRNRTQFSDQVAAVHYKWRRKREFRLTTSA
jgi:hypothetical protein